MNPEATPALGGARVETDASAARAALLTPPVPFHRQKGGGSQRGIEAHTLRLSHAFSCVVRLLDPREMTVMTSIATELEKIYIIRQT